MIKKISAIVLALVLCLSVVVVPASAIELGSAKIGYEIKLDKEYYSAGDTAVVSVYVNASEEYELGTALLMIGVSSAISVDSITDIQGTAVGNDTMLSLYTDPTSWVWAWANANQKNAVSGSNTADENAVYTEYLRIQPARDANSSITNKNGLPAADLNADEAPFLQFELKIADGLEPGTPITVGIPSGVLAKNQTYFNYYKNPGNATTVAKISNSGAVSIVAEATVGTPFVFPTFTIGAGKDAIRFEKNADKSYANKVTIRTMAKIAAADLQAATGATANDDIEAKIKSVGFVYAPSTTAFNAADAQAVAQGGTVAGYVKQPVSYIQNDGTSYNFTCLVEVQDADVASANFNTYAYIELDFGANGTKYYFSADVDAISAQALYSANKDAAWEKYGW